MVVYISLLIIINFGLILSFQVMKQTIDLNKIRLQQNIFEISKFQKSNEIIFISGGANLMPSFIYSEFIDILKSNNFNVNFVDRDKIINDNINNKKFTILGHSSCVEITIKLCNKYKNIENIIFLDPVDNRISLKDLYLNLRKKYNPIKLPYVKKMMILKAEKSYKFSLKPFILPFIPVLGLNENNFKSNKKLKISLVNMLNFGHADILNKNWGDFMHYNRICIGNNNRNSSTFYNYYKWLSVKIIEFLNS